MGCRGQRAVFLGSNAGEMGIYNSAITLFIFVLFNYRADYPVYTLRYCTYTSSIYHVSNRRSKKNS